MRRSSFLLIALVVAGCGGGSTKTVTETKTVTKTVTAPAAGGTAQAPAGAPLPEGVIAADGTYAMKTRKSDYEGENTAVDDQYPTDSEWVFKTTCQGSDCTIAMRRELGSGAFKNVVLRADPQRENVYVADTTGTTGCASSDKRAPTKQHYSVRLLAPIDVGGRQTAKRMDVYFTETTKQCPLSKGEGARGIVSWRGNLPQ